MTAAADASGGRRPVALTIAGSDSGGGAGIQADLKTFAAFEVYGASAITAVTAQNTTGVTGVHELPVEMVRAQIDAVASDVGADAVKVGMLSSSAIIEAVAERVTAHGVERLVVDPVMVAKGGDRLLREDAAQTLASVLLPLALVATPNADEASVLCGRPVTTTAEARDAARAVHALGCRYVVVKGGHFGDEAVDVLYDGASFAELPAKRIPTTSTHGTGCTFSSAIAAGLARGETVERAVAEAKVYVTAAIASAFPVGSGHGPLHHFHKWWRP